MERFGKPYLDEVHVDAPYPPIRVENQDPYYARLLSAAFAGRGSEMTSIAQYTVHNLYTDAYPPIHAALSAIARVEMTHLDILGRLILKLGTEPIYASYETSRYWTGSYPEYVKRIDRILLSNIAAEKSSIAYYQKLLTLIKDPHILSALRRIIADEEQHLAVLARLLEGAQQAQ